MEKSRQRGKRGSCGKMGFLGGIKAREMSLSRRGWGKGTRGHAWWQRRGELKWGFLGSKNAMKGEIGGLGLNGMRKFGRGDPKWERNGPKRRRLPDLIPFSSPGAASRVQPLPKVGGKKTSGMGLRQKSPQMLRPHPNLALFAHFGWRKAENGGEGGGGGRNKN